MASTLQFLADGGRELARKTNRAGLRRRLAAEDRTREQALAQLGQTAWQAKVDVSAFADLAGRIAQLDARAGDLTAGSAQLDKERADVDVRRQAEVSRFDTLLAPAKAGLSDADAALRAARAALKADASTDAAVKARLSAEVDTRAAERERRAAEIARLEAERNAALKPIDADRARIVQAAAAATKDRAAVGRDQTDRFRELGAALYEKRPAETAVKESVQAVATIDERRTAAQAAIDASLGLTKVMPAGTMTKFWAVVVLVPAVVGAVAYGASTWRGETGSTTAGGGVSGGAAEVRTGGRRPDDAIRPAVVDEERQKDATVRAYLQARGDEERRREGLDVLYGDIMKLGSSADRSLMPMFIKILEHGDPELRAGAAHAIGMIGPTAAELPLLTKALYDPRRRVREGAMGALSKMASSDPAIGMLVRRVQAGAPNSSRPNDDGLTPMDVPDAGRLRVPIYPGATFLPFGSDPDSGRLSFSSDDPPQKVADFYAAAASGRKPAAAEQFSREYFGASAEDPTGAKALMADQEAWLKRMVESGTPSEQIQAEAERRGAFMINLPALRYTDVTLFGDPVFVATEVASSGGKQQAVRYVAIFQDLGLGRTGFEIYVTGDQKPR